MEGGVNMKEKNKDTMLALIIFAMLLLGIRLIQ